MFYFTVEPLVQSAVYSFAYLIDGEPSLIGPTIRAGIQQAANNFVIYGIAWIESIVPFPPLPPFPIFPVVASVAATRAAIGSPRQRRQQLRRQLPRRQPLRRRYRRRQPLKRPPKPSRGSKIRSPPPQPH